jgi:DNA-directed RNA polymerase specialized sigma24 family protein
MLDDLESLTRRLKSAKTPEEKEQLWVELFPKLKRVAKNRIASAGRARQESATELVNDVFPGLQRALDNPATTFASRGDFMAYAATAMRRHRAAAARREVAAEVLDESFAIETAGPAASIAVSEALDALSSEMPRAVRAFELREYAGYSYDEILELMSRNYRTKALLAADLTMVRKALVRLLRAEPL